MLGTIIFSGFLILISFSVKVQADWTTENPYQLSILPAEVIIKTLPICLIPSSHGQICKTFDDEFKSRFRLPMDQNIIALDLEVHDATLETEDWYYSISDLEKTDKGFTFVLTDQAKLGTYHVSEKFYTEMATSKEMWEIVGSELVYISGADQSEIGKYRRSPQPIEIGSDL